MAVTDRAKFWLKVAGIGLGVGGAIIIFPPIFTVILNAVGFQAGGVAAGQYLQ